MIAGNALVLKPHEDTPLSAIVLAQLAEEAGVPPGVFSVLTGAGEVVGEALVKSPIPALDYVYRKRGDRQAHFPGRR